MRSLWVLHLMTASCGEGALQGKVTTAVGALFRPQCKLRQPLQQRRQVISPARPNSRMHDQQPQGKPYQRTFSWRDTTSPSCRSAPSGTSTVCRPRRPPSMERRPPSVLRRLLPSMLRRPEPRGREPGWAGEGGGRPIGRGERPGVAPGAVPAPASPPAAAAWGVGTAIGAVGRGAPPLKLSGVLMTVVLCVLFGELQRGGQGLPVQVGRAGVRRRAAAARRTQPAAPCPTSIPPWQGC